MVDYPIRFEAEVSDDGSDGWVIETAEDLETGMSVPKEFGGDSENPSPEDLFNASLASCILATFKVTAGRKGLEYESIEAESWTILERGDEGRPVMKDAEIKVKVKEVSNLDLAREIGDISEKNCFIHNSVRTDVETDFEFTR